ncbi:restriction endonuclease subunit S [Helicobacter sp. UBA3407]|nr:restriction endonuclease subunit S [Helicobacter sp. UBA3407]
MPSSFHNLPKNWQVKTLGEILSNDKYAIKRGPFGSSLKKEFFVDSGVRVFEQYNPINQDSNWKRYFITQQKFKELESFKAGAGDLLISCSGTLGKILELPKNVEVGIINQALLKIRLDNKQILNSYFVHLFNSPYMQNIILENTIGSAIQNIASVKVLKQIKIPLPPLKTQKAIVEKLENSFAHIDEAVHHLKAVQTNIPRLKSSLLHCAFSGKLTESQNSSHKVQTLKKRVVGEEGETSALPLHPLIKEEIPQGWEVKTLGEIGKVVSGGTPSTSNKDNFDGEIAWITPADLSSYKEKYISKGKRNLSEQGLKNSSARLLPPNSILFSSRAPIGYVAIASNALCTNQGFKNLIPNGNVSSEYIYYFLLHSKRLAESVASGTTFKEISAASFSKLPIPLPPLSTQKLIVQILESKFTHLDNLAQFVNASLENLQKLKSSLLNQAFKGELV